MQGGSVLWAKVDILTHLWTLNLLSRLLVLSACAGRYHSDRCAAIHVNMCVAQPSFTNPLHILQGINALLLPQLPLLLTSTEIQRVKVSKARSSAPALELSIPEFELAPLHVELHYVAGHLHLYC